MSKTAFPVLPFYANTPDGTHCFQAGIRMVLKYFLPKRDFSWAELEELSAKQPRKATWPQAAVLNLRKLGFTTVMVEGFDGPAFVRDGAAYLKQAFGEPADWMIENSDIPQEQTFYKQLLASDTPCENRIPALREIKEYLDKKYLVVCTVNSKKLNGQPSYVGHFVVIYGMDNQYVHLHDPGAPPMPSRKVSLKNFEHAWADPNEAAKNFIAIKGAPTNE